MTDMPELAELPPPPPVAGDDPHAEARRLQRLADGVSRLRSGGALRLGERILLILGGILAPLGLVLVLLGWLGASRSPYLFEQVPYLISGGLFGLGLCFLGSFMYFVHWLTLLVREHRAQSAAIVQAIDRLESRLATLPAGGPVAAAPVSNGDTPHLVATERGSMAHRPDCVVVAGKVGLRPVAANESLAACKLCDPYALATN